MKQRRNRQNKWLAPALALAMFAACSFGRARKDDPGSARPGAASASKGERVEEANDSGQATWGLNAKACRLLPVSDLEAQFGGKAMVRGGLDSGEGDSTCGARVNGFFINIQIDPPGPGVPGSVEEGLAGAKMLAEESEGNLTVDETRDFGTVGCYSGKVKLGFGPFKGTESASPNPGPSTVCFQVQGGLVILTVGNTENPKEKVSFEVVKGFLEKAAARR